MAHPDQLLTAGGGSPPSAYRALLGNRNFRYWFASAFTSSLGDWIGFVALTALITELYPQGSQSALFALGGLLMIRLLPSAVFGPISGVIADRYDRRTVLVVTDMLRCAIFAMITVSSDVLAIYALTFIVECVSLLFLAAKDASLPQVVDADHLTEANQLNLGVSYGTLPLGAVSASVMIAFAGGVGNLLPFDVDPLRVALGINAASFFFSGLLLFRVHLPGEVERSRRRREQLQRDDAPGLVAELREGLDFIRGFPLLRAIITGIVGVFFGAGVVIGLAPEFVRSTLGRPSADWSILLSAVGAGLVVGIAAVIPALRRFDKERTFPWFLASVGLLGAVTSLMPSFALVLPMGALLGAAAGVAVVQGYTLLQELTEDETRARTFALFYTLTRIALFASLALGPFVAGAIGTLRIGTDAFGFRIPGIRLTILFGAVVAAWSGLRAQRTIARFHADGERPGVRTSTPVAARRGGVFITFEGVEGAGKSTQIELLADALRREGHEVVTTREPGGSPIGDRIRALVLDPNAADMDSRTEALLMAAARAEHVAKVIRPALERGAVVLCDRYIDSSLAYQGIARGLGPTDVMEVNRWAVGGILADAVVLLNLDPSEGLKRVEERARRKQVEHARSKGTKGLFELPRITEQLAKDRLEREGLDFHTRVARGYLELARADQRRFLVVNALGDAHAIHRQIRAGLHAWLPLTADSAETLQLSLDDLQAEQDRRAGNGRRRRGTA